MICSTKRCRTISWETSTKTPAAPCSSALPCRRRLTASASATISVRYACTEMPEELVQAAMAGASTPEPPDLRGRANPPTSITRTDTRTSAKSLIWPWRRTTPSAQVECSSQYLHRALADSQLHQPGHPKKSWPGWLLSSRSHVMRVSRGYLCRQRITGMHLIRVAGHLGFKTPGVPPPLLHLDGGGQPWPCVCAQVPTTACELHAA